MAVRFPEEEKLYKVLSEHANYGGGPKNSANCDENGEAFQLDFLQDKPLLAQRVQEYMAWDKVSFAIYFDILLIKVTMEIGSGMEGWSMV